MSAAHDDLDEKLARLADRVRRRSEGTRERLAEIGALEVAEALRATFDARLVYLGPEAGFAHGQAYNFDLKGHAHAAAAEPVERESNRKQKPKRRGKFQPPRGRSLRTWHDDHD